MNLGALHPPIVHFAVALSSLGALARLLSLLPLGARVAFLGPMAAVLLLGGAGAATLATKSGMDAHGPVERVPGSREAVEVHEEWGERAHDALLVVGLLELVLLAARNRPRAARIVRGLSAAGALFSAALVLRTGSLGGELVYSYGGGVGLRTGDPADLPRTLVAALYHNAQAARQAGRHADAARLLAELGRQRPDDPFTRLLLAESRLEDEKDVPGALAALAAIGTAGGPPRLVLGHAIVEARARVRAGDAAGARAVVDAARKALPERFARRLDREAEKILGQGAK